MARLLVGLGSDINFKNSKGFLAWELLTVNDLKTMHWRMVCPKFVNRDKGIRKSQQTLDIADNQNLVIKDVNDKMKKFYNIGLSEHITLPFFNPVSTANMELSSDKTSIAKAECLGKNITPAKQLYPTTEIVKEVSKKVKYRYN
jgi:hypothetical protein